MKHGHSVVDDNRKVCIVVFGAMLRNRKSCLKRPAMNNSFTNVGFKVHHLRFPRYVLQYDNRRMIVVMINIDHRPSQLYDHLNVCLAEKMTEFMSIEHRPGSSNLACIMLIRKVSDFTMIHLRFKTYDCLKISQTPIQIQRRSLFFERKRHYHVICQWYITGQTLMPRRQNFEGLL
ncbi:hypothetical protein BDF20DRAFT_832696 [Mycotypha africana]|uniref:uncharacterized protein n=1 Tax=Mycotypha africana TaxID=64632 RepID=UPI00230144B9|nr:uncharacterized protein BDF20DRAFT_832696 [Mycotypha africana]KAI8987793.1 hypothetical protein BDF20DRAFT_832696 [Mycotypha africana]